MNAADAPFKFLNAYQKEDRAIFFGREEETEALYHALSGVKHLLLYGPSGAGKTSLVECGLRNQFSEADWFALTVRRRKNLNASVFAAINTELDEKFSLDEKTGFPTDPDFTFGNAIERLFAERIQPIYLLFDQFEELLLLGTETEKISFFTRLNRLIRYPVPCRVILIMREEFIGFLSEFEPYCPTIFEQRFRLEKMRRVQVKKVIESILTASKYQSAFRVIEPTILADKILTKLPDEQSEIELTHLQVFLGELWQRAREKTSANQSPELNAELVKANDNLATVLDHFLRQQLKKLTPHYGEQLPLEVLAVMISERFTKLQLSANEIETELKRSEVAIDQPITDLLADLQREGIVRALKVGERSRYEISHDLLAQAVGENLTEEIKLRNKATEVYQLYSERSGLFAQADLDFMRPFMAYKPYPSALEKRITESQEQIEIEQRQRERQLEAEKAQLLKQRRTQRRFLVAAAAAAGLFLVFAGYYFMINQQIQQVAFEAQIQAAKGQKEQGNYNKALVMLEKASSLASGDEQQQQVQNTVMIYTKITRLMLMAERDLIEDSFRIGINKLRQAKEVAEDNYINTKINNASFRQVNAQISILNQLKGYLQSAPNSESSAKNFKDTYDQSDKYLLEFEIHPFQDEIDQHNQIVITKGYPDSLLIQ